MELQQLRYVIALAEEANFTRAATRCFVAQSALSHSIKNLESELGFALFSRTSRKVALTTAGEAFLLAARDSVRAAERAVVDATAAEGKVSGRLSVGVIPTLTAIDVIPTLKQFRQIHPGVTIAYRVAGSDELEVAISRGDVDVGFLGLPANRPPRGVSSRLLASDELVAVVNEEHHLSKKNQLRLSDLAGETFADFVAGTPAREESDIAFRNSGIRRNVEFESMDINLSLDLVLHNLAITLLPSRFAPKTPPLIALRIIDGPSRLEYVAWNDFNPSPAALAFLQLISE